MPPLLWFDGGFPGVQVIVPGWEPNVQIQINSDGSVDTHADAAEEVETLVRGALERFGERITRVEVHLSDVNGAKGGVDTRCVLEARVAGRPPVAVDEQAEDVHGAVRGASAKLVRVLDHQIARNRGH